MTDSGPGFFLGLPPNRQPREAQMIAVSELRAGRRQAEKGMQELDVRDHGWDSSSEKRIDPAGSLRWLRRLPCGWCQIPRTFPSGPFTNVGVYRGDGNPRNLSPGYTV